MPTFGQRDLVCGFLFCLLLGRRMMNGDGDLGRHITIGNTILDNWKISPPGFIFPHDDRPTPDPHEWRFPGFYLPGQNESPDLTAFSLCVLLFIATSFWLVYKRVRPFQQKSFIALLVVILALITLRYDWLTRPHIFTFLFLALWLLILEKLRLGKSNRWWLLPILMLVWANVHGAFMPGFVTWLIFGVGVAWIFSDKKLRSERRYPNIFGEITCWAARASFLVSFINPSGFDLWKTSVGYVGTRYLVNIH